MKKLIGFLKTKIKLIIVAICVIIAVLILLNFLPALSITSESITMGAHKPLTTVIGEIKDEGKKLVGESETKKLYINTKTLNLILEDKKTGTIWNAIHEKSKNGIDLSLLNVAYLGEDNSITEWNSYDFSVKNSTYSIKTIENGVQIHFNFNKGESTSFYEYMPTKMSTERYQTFFLGGLEKLQAEGKLTGDQVSKYKSTMSLIYAKSKTEEAYILNYVGNPPTSAIKQLIEIAKLVGYTTDLLLEDANTFGFTVTFQEPAVFDIVLEAVLEGDEFVARIPSGGMVSQNNFYEIQNIEVLPNFGTVEMSEVEDGYLFVPDGAGALLKMNSYNPKITEYSRSVYDNNYFMDYYWLPEHGEALMMPVFGLLYNAGSKNSSGFLGIIEEGADGAYIDARLASTDTGSATSSSLNKVYSSFDVIQYHAVNVFGEYSDGASYLVSTKPSQVDYQVRYILYPEKVTYFDMAKSYQNYILRNIERDLVYPKEAKLYLSTIGTLSLNERILGIPYQTEYSMTTYKELMDIITDLGERNLVLSYQGAFDGGMNNRLMNQGKLVKSNGTKEELEELMKLIKEKDDTLFLETDFLKIYSKGNGFINKLHGLYDFSSKPVDMYGYNLAIGWFTQNSNQYKLLNPKYLYDIVNDFINKEDMNANLYLEDLTHAYYANYKNGEFISPYKAQEIINKSIKALGSERLLALDNPRMDKILYGSYAVDISRESSDYGTFYSTIPFRQLALNGIIEYTTSNVNNNSMDERYYLLQALELGAHPKFTISSKNVDVLKDSNYAELYSIEYSKLHEIIKEVYDDYAKAMDIIGVAKIVNHEILTDNVFITEYESGVKVITNYNGKSISINGYDLEPYGYQILKEE